MVLIVNGLHQGDDTLPVQGVSLTNKKELLA